MTPSIRHKGRNENRVNYLASVSDLMSGLLFVFILTLAVAIIQARSATGKAERKPKTRDKPQSTPVWLNMT